jgi:1-acyl-sn-glycerol-3-phosphate acyltransferase
MPNLNKFVLILAPHTSNWDFVVGFFAYLALGLDAAWFGKHTLFRGPAGPILRYFGGIPIDRARAANVVDLYVAEFDRRERLVLAMAPEGTRRRVAEWKSGFYRIATAVGVPIVPVAIDYSTRELRIMPAPVLSGDQERDIAAIQRLFSPSMAKHPVAFQAAPPESAHGPDNAR